MIDPYLPPTPLATERSNRLTAVRALPGYVEIMRISAQLADEAAASLVDWPGWDMQQLVTLKARAQAAKEHHNMLFDRIERAIRDGVAEADEKKDLQVDQTKGSIRMADEIREEFLKTMPEELRIPGSY